MELLVIRHARPERIELSEGLADPPLTEVGHQQARALARFLASEGIDHIVSSPMRRARQTAQPLADTLGVAPEIVDDLAEIDRDSSAYLPTEDVKRNDPELWNQWITDPLSMYEADIEPFTARVLAAWDQVIDANPGRTVAAFCHGMVTMVLLQSIVGYGNLFTLNTDYASITRVRASSSHAVRSVQSVNETGHLGHTRIML